MGFPWYFQISIDIQIMYFKYLGKYQHTNNVFQVGKYQHTNNVFQVGTYKFLEKMSEKFCLES